MSKIKFCFIFGFLKSHNWYTLNKFQGNVIAFNIYIHKIFTTQTVSVDETFAYDIRCNCTGN